MSEKYRPSNGTEGECFIGAWCCNCARSEANRQREDASAMHGCPILDRTLAFDVDDPEYPVEWIVDDAGPRCTAFVQDGDPLPTPRCEHTSDMFEVQA